MAEIVDFDQVLSRFEKKVEILARRYLKGTTASYELDDLRQEARLALWLAWQRDKEMGRGFSALAEKIIWRKLYDYRLNGRFEYPTQLTAT
jgi:DNA-directed RNA polymerase specialized sigma subunit